MSLLREELIGQGFNLAYIPSTHQIDETMDLSRVPKKVLNALQVHNLVKYTLDRGHTATATTSTRSGSANASNAISNPNPASLRVLLSPYSSAYTRGAI